MFLGGIFFGWVDERMINQVHILPGNIVHLVYSRNTYTNICGT